MAGKPDTSSSLSQEEKDKLIQWLTEKAGKTGGLVCSVCNTRKWTVGDDLVMSLIFTGNKVQFGSGVGYPQAMLICDNCGHTVFINSVRAGLSEGTEAESDPPEDSAAQAEEAADG